MCVLFITSCLTKVFFSWFNFEVDLIHPQYGLVLRFMCNSHSIPGERSQSDSDGLKATVLLRQLREFDECISPVLFCVNLLLTLEAA